MATQSLTQPKVTVEEYLATVNRPDCDYVDGEVQERNVGEWEHGSTQSLIAAYFVARRSRWGVGVSTEQRVQVGPERFRIPDVCVILGRPEASVLYKPPFLCIEILSPEDRMSRVRQRVDDFLSMGVSNVWVVDPVSRAAYTVTPADGWREVKDGVLRTAHPAFDVPLAEIFA